MLPINLRVVLSPLTISLTMLTSGVSLANEINTTEPTVNIQKNINIPSSQQTTPFGLSQEELQALSNQITWHRLLLYPDGKNKSEVDPTRLHGVRQSNKDANAHFFLAKDGHVNPFNELLAILYALENPKTAQEIACRFPARTHWLLTQNIKINPKLTPCENTLIKSNITKISLLFAEEYPDSTGSAFAHTILRLDDATNNNATAYTINFATDESAKTSALVNMAHAITGKNDSALIIEPYQDKIHKYLWEEGRDIWRYQINLSQEEIQQVIRHVQEVKDLSRPYFFTHNNCATEILRLIDVVKPQQNLRAQAKRVVIPTQISRILDKNQLLIDHEFIASNRTRYQAAINAGFTSAKPLRQSKSIDERNQILANAPLPSDFVISPSQNDSALGSGVHRIGLAVGREQQQNYLSLQTRIAYHDALDSYKGTRAFQDTMLLSLDARLYHNKSDTHKKIELNDFTLVKLRALNPSNSAESGNAWGGKIALLRVADASTKQNQQHLVAHIGGEYGKSWVLGKAKANTGMLPPTLCYTLATGSIQTGHINKGYRVGVGATLGCISYFEKIRLMSEIELPYWYQGNGKGEQKSAYLQPILTLGAQYNLNKNNALRFTGNFKKQNGSTTHNWQLGYMRYF